MVRDGDSAGVQTISKDQARHLGGVVGLSQSDVFSKHSRTLLECRREDVSV